MPHCSVTGARFHDMGTGRTLQQAGFAQTDDKGEYRISNLPRGKYYIQARCNQTLLLPHALIRRSSTMDAPALTYAPQFYAGAANPAGAAKVEALPGADISGSWAAVDSISMSKQRYRKELEGVARSEQVRMGILGVRRAGRRHG
jgi:hypothetical protein